MHWVLIETGSNQPYIFATNKQRLQLAASREIRNLGEGWIAQAVEEANKLKPGSADHIVRASGTGMVRVADVETGRSIVNAITRCAVERRTGLDVWGYVHDVDDADDPGRVVSELAVAQRQHGLLRSQRLPPLIQSLNNPFEQQCSFTGRPAVPYGREERDGGGALYRSAAIARLWDSSGEARGELIKGLRELRPGDAKAFDPEETNDLEMAVVSSRRLQNGDDIANNGWVGVLHADGNGIGSVFSHLVEASDGGRSFLDLERSLSADLGSRMWRVVAETIIQCQCAHTADGGAPADWVLPIVIGGDDVTVVLHGGMAWDFTRALIDNFARSFRAGPFPAVLKDIKVSLERKGDVAAGSIPETLTLGAGLLFVKPHHPFSHAVSLAEQLAASAKRYCKPYGGVDTEVLFESAVRDLDAIRDSQRATDGTHAFQRFGGPFIVSDDESDPRNIQHLESLLSALRSADIPRGVLHSLREAINTDTSPLSLRAVLERVFLGLASRRDIDSAVVARLRRDVLGDESGLPGIPVLATPDRFIRILTALDLLDVARGTAAGRQAEAGRTKTEEELR